MFVCFAGDSGAGAREQLLREPGLPSPRRGPSAESGAVLAGSSALPRTVSILCSSGATTVGILQCPQT